MVFDPVIKTQRFLNIPNSDQILDFVGKVQSDNLLCEALSKGEVNPEIQENEFFPHNSPLKS